MIDLRFKHVSVTRANTLRPLYLQHLASVRPLPRDVNYAIKIALSLLRDRTLVVFSMTCVPGTALIEGPHPRYKVVKGCNPGRLAPSEGR